MQVVTNSYQIKPKQFSAAYRFRPAKKLSSADKLVGKILLKLIPVAIVGAIIIVLLPFLMFIAVFLPLLLLAIHFIRTNNTTFAQTVYGYNPKTQFVTIKENQLDFHFEDKSEYIVFKEDISYIRKTTTDYLVFFNDTVLMMIPQSAFNSDEDRKFFTRNYFVHYS